MLRHEHFHSSSEWKHKRGEKAMPGAHGEHELQRMQGSRSGEHEYENVHAALDAAATHGGGNEYDAPHMPLDAAQGNGEYTKPPAPASYSDSRRNNEDRALTRKDAGNIGGQDPKDHKDAAEASGRACRRCGIGSTLLLLLAAGITTGVVFGVRSDDDGGTEGMGDGTSSGGGAAAKPKPPISQPDFSLDNAPGATVTIDVGANDSPGKDGKAIKKGSVEFEEHDDNAPRSKTVKDEGVWTASDSALTVTFTPDKGLKGDPSLVSYTVESGDGLRSAPASITVTYLDPGDTPKPKPVLGPTISNLLSDGTTTTVSTGDSVIVFDLVKGTPRGLPALEGEHGIDADTVMLIAILTDVSVDAKLSADNSVMTVSGQGVWSTRPGGQVWFKAEPSFGGEPSPVRVQIADTEGNLSRTATLIVSKDTVDALEELKGLATISDDDFWSALEAEVQTSQAAISTEALGLMIYGFLSANANLMSRKDAEAALGSDAIPSGKALEDDFTQWAADDFSAKTFFELGDKTVTPASTGLGGTPLAVRVARLRYMADLMNLYFDEINAALPKT